MPYLGIFELEFETKLSYFEQYLRICLTAKFREIRKMPKFGTKNASCRYFWVRISKMLLSYLKSALSNLSSCKILRKNNF